MLYDRLSDFVQHSCSYSRRTRPLRGLSHRAPGWFSSLVWSTSAHEAASMSILSLSPAPVLSLLPVFPTVALCCARAPRIHCRHRVEGGGRVGEGHQILQDAHVDGGLTLTFRDICVQLIEMIQLVRRMHDGEEPPFCLQSVYVLLHKLVHQLYDLWRSGMLRCWCWELHSTCEVSDVQGEQACYDTPISSTEKSGANIPASSTLKSREFDSRKFTSCR